MARGILALDPGLQPSRSAAWAAVIHPCLADQGDEARRRTSAGLRHGLFQSGSAGTHNAVLIGIVSRALPEEAQDEMIEEGKDQTTWDEARCLRVLCPEVSRTGDERSNLTSGEKADLIWGTGEVVARVVLVLVQLQPQQRDKRQDGGMYLYPTAPGGPARHGT